MKAFVTSDISVEALNKLREILKDDVVYESWRETKNLYFKAEDLVKKIKEIGAEIYICEGDNVKKDALEQLNLKIIGSTRDDPNNIDVETATKRNLPVLFAPKRNTISVAEMTVTLILALARNLHQVERVIHSTAFKVNEFSDYVKYYNLFKGFELNGKTVGIIGLGAIGYEVAKRLLPFNVKFLVYDPYVPATRLAAINAQAVELNTLMAQSDIITLHVPPLDSTDGMVGKTQFDLMKPTAYFVNLARASITDEAYLLEILKAKKIAGAALDVFTVEPLDHENEFLKLDNVIACPHLGGDTRDTNHRHGMMIVEDIERILNQKQPLYCKNPEVLSSFEKVTPPASPADINPIPDSLQFYAPQGQKILEVFKIMVEKGFIVGAAGNLSMRVKLRNGEDAFLVTPSNYKDANMKIEDLVLCDGNGEAILGTRNPTSEKIMHITIMKARPEINAIVHSHAPYSTTLAIAKMPIGPIVDEIIPFIGGCEVAEYGIAGSKELANNAVKALGENYACFIANHGNICCGVNMDHAWTVCQQVEIAARIQWQAALLGTIYALPQEAEDAEKEIFGIMKDANSIK